jgi:hypothetical protein
MTNAVEASAAGEPLRSEIRLLATLLFAFAVIKIAASSLAYTSAVVVAGGVDTDGSRTLFWLPQILFYTLFATAARRLRRFEPRARAIVVSLSALSIGATVLYTVLDFTVGPGRERPAMAIAIKLRLLAGGDVWDIVFPALAILWLRTAQARRLFEPR